MVVLFVVNMLTIQVSVKRIIMHFNAFFAICLYLHLVCLNTLVLTYDCDVLFYLMNKCMKTLDESFIVVFN